MVLTGCRAQVQPLAAVKEEVPEGRMRAGCGSGTADTGSVDGRSARLEELEIAGGVGGRQDFQLPHLQF